MCLSAASNRKHLVAEKPIKVFAAWKRRNL